MRNPAAAARPRKPSLFKKKETALAPAHRKPLKQRLVENWQLYLLLLIPLAVTIVYKYWPMYGIQIAFRDFTASRGIWGSEWVGFEWFERFFSSPNCGRMIVNTVLISLYSLLWSFPVPIILALALINQILSVYGIAVLPIEDGQVETLVSTAWTVAAAVAAWWKNNSFTSAAIAADQARKEGQFED